MTTNSTGVKTTPITPPPPPGPKPIGSTATGLDALVDLITADPGLAAKIPLAEVYAGARFADQLDALIVEAIRATGVANDANLTAADLYDVNAWLRATHAADWVALHGNDEYKVETGFHLVQGDGATTVLYDRNAVNTVADGIYHLGFEICNGQLLNEDGNANARLTSVATWLSSLLANDLAAGTLANASVDPYVDGTTHTGLDQLVSIVTNDPGLSMKISNADIRAGATAADRMDALIVEAIRATGIANNGNITAADVYDLNAWLRANVPALWVELHGDDEDDAETGFHLVQNDGATTKLYGQNAVDTVADGLYHLGFEICDGQLLNEDGMPNARIGQVAKWLSDLLAADLAAGTLDNAAFDPYVKGTTGTGLDQLVSIVTRDPGLNMKISTTEIHDGALAADRLDHLIVDAIRATGAADGGTIDVAEVRELNGWIRANRLAEWTALHGDDESDSETGFHLVQNDGATTALYGQNAVNTVADGIYHLGFEIMKGRVVNEDGDANASLSSLAGWLNQLLAADLAGGTLLVPSVALVGAAPADFSAAGLAFA